MDIKRSTQCLPHGVNMSGQHGITMVMGVLDGTLSAQNLCLRAKMLGAHAF